MNHYLIDSRAALHRFPWIWFVFFAFWLLLDEGRAEEVQFLYPNEFEYLFDETDQRVDFSFGDDCLLLADLNPEAMRFLVDLRHKPYWQHFCTVFEQYECSEIAYMVKGYGLLEPSPIPNYCRFVPFPRIHELQADYYKNYG